MAKATSSPVPGAELPIERMPGHWLLARMGKRVLRPGGRELTDRMLGALGIGPADEVVELAPGLGSTTELVLASNPNRYVGVDRDPVSAQRVEQILAGGDRSVIQASAAETGLDDASFDVAFGEAYLTMQPDSQKRRIVAELARIVRPGGRLGLHEIAFAPDGIDAARIAGVERALTGSIRVNVSPLTIAGWVDLLDQGGFDVQARFTAPMHLLEPRRLIADEGLPGALRFVGRVLTNGEARKRVRAMRSAIRSNASHLQALALVAVRRSA